MTFAYHQPDALLPVRFRPLVWLFNGMANNIFRCLQNSMVRKETTLLLTIFYAVWWKPARWRASCASKEHELINVFELESRTVLPSSMTSREYHLWLICTNKA